VIKADDILLIDFVGSACINPSRHFFLLIPIIARREAIIGCREQVGVAP